MEIDTTQFTDTAEITGTAEVWRVRYEALLLELQLNQAAFHEYRTRHHVTLRPPFRCLDCTWKAQEGFSA